MKERKYWLAFSACYGIGPARFALLLKHFGSAEAAWKASLSDLQKSGIGAKASEGVVDFRNAFSFERYDERMKKHQISFVTSTEEDYPSLLKEVTNAPFVLYVLGDRSLLRTDPNKMLAVVGTRKITEYGRQVTELLVGDLVASGCVIVSGLAMGVDATAHRSTLHAGGKTIAVLGSGVDYCTPQENQSLYERIVKEGGAIVSETPLGQMPNKGSFPMRNRIIAGMSSGVLVTEGAADSGSLITAKDALKYNRKVFAVPGPITSTVSKGPISLIANGATMVMSATDIITEIGLKSIKSNGIKPVKGDSKEEQKIIDLLENESMHFDEIVKRLGFHSSQVGTLLSLMEMKGMIRNLDAGMYTVEI